MSYYKKSDYYKVKLSWRDFKTPLFALAYTVSIITIGVAIQSYLTPLN